MRKSLAISAILICASSLFGQNGFIDTARIYNAENYKKPFVPGEFIVAFKSGLTDFVNPNLSNATRLRSRRNLAIAKRPKDHKRAFTDRNLVLMISDDTTHDGTLANLRRVRQDPNVAYVEPNYILHAFAVPNDPSFSLQWNMQNTGQTGGTPHADIDATQAWNTTQGNSNLLIGVIDTGIDYLHPDLAANIWTNPGEIPNNEIDDDGNGFIDDVHGFNFVNNTGNPMDDNNHGTHVAGIIAAAGNNGIGVTGVAWKASLVAIKFLDSTGNGTVDAAINAINYANAMGITITNNSWGGGGFSQAMKDVIDAAGAKGDLFFAAGGNSGTNNDSTPFYPSSYTSSNLVAVAATDDNDALASFSDYGKTSVDLAAPGVNIYSTKPGSSYQYLSGTSMATPHVAGAAALLWSSNPTLTFTQVKNYLMQGVDSIASLKGRLVSGGRLNVEKALTLAAPPSIAYQNATLSAVRGVPIPQDTAISTGGTVSSYAMNSATPLPAGLSLNVTTGVLSGIPTAVTIAVNDTVIATGANGTGKAVVNISVADTAPAISYRHGNILTTKNTTIAPDSVISTGGAITSYAMSIFTPLPAGLSLNGLTGTISGTPANVTAGASDTIIATGPGGTGRTVVSITVTDTAPAISYKHAIITAIKNVAIAPDSTTSTGGAITSYAASTSTPLPAGLSLNNSIGIISGTPTAVTAGANDTIIAVGPGGTGKTVVTIAVADTAPSISYKHIIVGAVKNVAIIPDTAVSIGGAITSYAMSASTPLPAGLSLNNSTGIISGTPTIVTGAANDTVVAIGPGGTGKTVLSIAVADTSPAVSYKHVIIAAIRNAVIVPDSAVSIGGAITSYAMGISTPLPAGLSVNGVTGIISGTPTMVTTATNDTVIAAGPGGVGKAVVNIAVVDTAPAISYKRQTITAVRNVSLTPDTAVSVGGAITSYALGTSTPLPAGLSLNSVTGTISGTPTTVTTATNDTIIATGPGGIGKTLVSIAVLDTAPAIFYRHQTIAAVRNITIIPDTAISSGGAIASYAMAALTPLPAGLSLSTATGIISGIPTVITPVANDTILAMGPGGIGRAVLKITVTDTAPSIFYKLASIVAVKNAPIIPDTAISIGGSVSSFTMSLSTPLPAGLSLNSGTGIISGTPTTAAGASNDTVIAMGPGGTGKAVVSVTVNSVVAILDPYVVRLPGLNAFSFRVPEGSLSVRIMVQDIRGKTVWSREQAVGKNNLVSWDGGDSNGQSVPAGIYVVRLKLLDAEHNASEVRQVDALVP